MTLDTNKPTDQVDVSELSIYIREDRVAINAVSGAGNVGVTNLEVAAGTTSLAVGTELGTYGYETVIISGAAVVALATILGGTEGQVKIFIFQDTNVHITDGNIKLNGALYLNQLPAGVDFDPQQDDILALVNVGGDGASIYGYWKELYRTLSLK